MHRGTRGNRGRKDRLSNKLRGQNIQAVRRADVDRFRDKSNVIGGMDGATKFFDVTICSETQETHIIPRESITKKQALAIFPIQSDVMELRGRQLLKVDDGKGNLIPQFDKDGNPILVEVTNRQAIDRPVNSLLRKGIPFQPDRKIGRRSHYDRTWEADRNTGIADPITKPNMAEVSISLNGLGLEAIEDPHDPKKSRKHGGLLIMYTVLYGSGSDEIPLATADTLDQAKKQLRFLVDRKGYRFDDLAIRDNTTQRLISLKVNPE